MKTITSYLKNNPCYKAGDKIKVKGLMLHSVGCPQPDANVFVKQFNKEIQKCVHAFIDANNGNVYQTLPFNYKAWHCGGKGNGTHIGIEMCEPPNIKYSNGNKIECKDKKAANVYVGKTYNTAVILFANLCKKYKLNPLEDGVIVSHKEGNKKGIASNHGDPEHLWEQLDSGYSMKKFRNDVYNTMYPKKKTKKQTTKLLMVRVKISDLNIRKGPGTNYSKTGKYTGKGVFTIVETKDGKGSKKGWGKLKNGSGWISLDYVDII